MKRCMYIFLIIAIIVLIGCSKTNDSGYNKISAQTGSTMLEENSKIVLIDVRTKEEYDSGHIQGSILIPHDEIADKIKDVVPKKSTPIIVYCRSGSRSKTAANTLIELGYSEIYDMGGIIDWPYETTK